MQREDALMARECGPHPCKRVRTVCTCVLCVRAASVICDQKAALTEYGFDESSEDGSARFSLIGMGV